MPLHDSFAANVECPKRSTSELLRHHLRNRRKTDLQVEGLSSSTFGGGTSLPTTVGPYHYYSVEGNLTEQLSLTGVHNLKSATAAQRAGPAQ